MVYDSKVGSLSAQENRKIWKVIEREGDHKKDRYEEKELMIGGKGFIEREKMVLAREREAL